MRPVTPFAAVLIGIGLFSLMDALMKGASLAVGAYSALMVRSVIGLGLAAPLWLATRPRWPAASTVRLHLLRGTVAAGMAFTSVMG